MIKKIEHLESGIHFVNDNLIFTAFESHEVGQARYCKSFEVPLEAIKIIVISPRLVLDDEFLFILIVDKRNNIFPMPYHILDCDGFLTFIKHFELKSIPDDWSKFEYGQHYGKIDKVIYPKEHYWKNLFKQDWKLGIRLSYSWIHPKSFYGNIATDL